MTEQTSRAQMAKALTVCSKFDGRVLDPETFEAWWLLLNDLPYEDIVAAIKDHYRTDRRWIRPADIVAYHEKLAGARAVEQAFRNPPACWSCGVAYELSAVPGSSFARPAGPHGDGCR